MFSDCVSPGRIWIVERVGLEAVLANFHAMRAAGELHDQAAAPFGAVPPLAVDDDDGVAGLDADVERAEVAALGWAIDRGARSGDPARLRPGPDRAAAGS